MSAALGNVRGSRKHVLDWSGQPSFAHDIMELASPLDCRIHNQSAWKPRGHSEPAEAELVSFGPLAYPNVDIWPDLASWWLKHSHRLATTPNWDVALSCDIVGVPGLILIEAKANVPELSAAGKKPPSQSERSVENHEHIGHAIQQARTALRPEYPDLAISRDSHYQLSNRIAFAWKLASLGMPVVLMYLGFLGDTGVANVGEPFSDDAHWQRVFGSYLAEIGGGDLLDAETDCGAASFWLLSRSRRILEVSPAALPFVRKV